MKCYKHGDDHNIDHGGEAPPTDDQKKTCGEDEDVCSKVYWLETNRKPPVIQTKRDCETKEYLKSKGWKGSECFIKEGKKDFHYCGCTTDYCNTSTITTPFHYLPLIAISFVKTFFI